MIPAESGGTTVEGRKEHDGPVELLLRLTANARLFRSTDGRCYAQVDDGGRREIYALKSAVFRDWLTDRYFRESARGSFRLVRPSGSRRARGHGAV